MGDSDKDFKKLFGRMQMLMFIWFGFICLFALGVFGFIIYISFKVLSHFGVL